jgi:hypothetical protein
MKLKIMMMAFCAFAALTMEAQTGATAPLGRTTFGFRAGVNFQNFNGKDQNGDMLSNNLVTRFHGGVNVEIPIAVDFYLQPGLLYITKGTLRKQTINGEKNNATATLGYIEMPINLLYKPLLGTGHLIIGFGPYVAYGVWGKAKYEVGATSRTEDVVFKNTVSSTDRTDVTYFRPFDAGANIIAGYEFSNRISFQLNAQLGMLRVNPTYSMNPNDQSSAKNTGFGLSLGYRL